MTRRWIHLGTLAVLAVFAMVVVACGDDDDDDTASVDVCDQRAAVEDAVADLSNVDVLAEGTDELRAHTEAVRDELNILAGAVQESVQGETDDFNTALSDAEAAFANLGEGDALLDQVADITAAISNVASSGAALVAALDQECD